MSKSFEEIQTEAMYGMAACLLIFVVFIAFLFYIIQANRSDRLTIAKDISIKHPQCRKAYEVFMCDDTISRSELRELENIAINKEQGK